MVIFERLAQLLMPVEKALAARAVEAAHSWDIRDLSLDTLDAAVWGRAPMPSGSPRAPAARAAYRRERSLVRLRRGVDSGLRAVAVHRWRPADLRSGGPRRVVRRALLGGALVELSTGSYFARNMDAASSAAGFPGRVGRFRPASGGSVRITSEARPGELLRVGATGSPIDPARAADALAALGAAGMRGVPRLVRRGNAGAASWSVETAMPGVPPQRLTPRLLAELVAFCSDLPPGSGSPTALDEDLVAICTLLPSKAEPIRELVDGARAACSLMPSVARHGDLWTGNLLVGRKGELEGVLDWDAWHPTGVPGGDLLHLYAWDRARNKEQSLGECWIRRPWLDAAFVAATEPYWKEVGLQAAPEVLDAVGLAWWANQVATSLRRLPHLASHAAWVAANVDVAIGIRK